jgi:ankyrin repeat protein
MPTDCYQIIASFLDRVSRVRLGECDRHLHDQVLYGRNSAGAVWRVGRFRDGDEMKAYLEQKYSRRQVTMTALGHASWDGNVSMVRLLIKANADVEATSVEGESTPLHYACLEGHDEVVDVLVAAGANINALNRNDWSPLCDASGHNRMSTVNRLIELGADVNAGRPLLRASVEGHTNIIRALLAANANVHLVDRHGGNALHAAAGGGAVDVIPILLAAGANINQVDLYNGTPLHLACSRLQPAAATALVAANADLNIVDIFGKSPLIAASANGDDDSVRALLAANADVHLVDNHGNTALGWANGYDSTVELLLDAGAVVLCE